MADPEDPEVDGLVVGAGVVGVVGLVVGAGVVGLVVGAGVDADPDEVGRVVGAGVAAPDEDEDEPDL